MGGRCFGAGAVLAVHFVGVLHSDRSVFDSSFKADGAAPLRITMGAGQVHPSVCSCISLCLYRLDKLSGSRG